MKKSHFLYAAALLFSFLYALGMQQYPGWVVFLIALFFPVFEILLYWLLMRGSMSIEVEVLSDSGEEKKKLQICMINHAYFLPVGHGEAVFEIVNSFTGKKKRMKLAFSVDAGMEESFILEDELGCPGKYIVIFRRVSAYDFLGLVPLPMWWEKPVELIVMPEPIGDLQNLVLNGGEWEGDSNIYSRLRMGSDASELLDIRDYRRGDMRNRIHWRQTAKLGKLMVKDYAFPLDFGVGLFVDLNWRHLRRDEKHVAEQVQNAYLLGMHLVMERIPFLLVWYNDREGELMQREVWSEQDLYEVFAQMLGSRVYSSDTSLAVKYREAGGRRLEEICYFSSNRIYEFEYLWTLLESGHLQIKRCQ